MSFSVRLRKIVLAVVACAAPIAVATPTHAVGLHGLTAIETSITPAEWQVYKGRYITNGGRVVDVEKSGVSHSESQSYGLYLAMAADDQPTFERILDFTLHNMRGRSDQLISWLYNPNAHPRITDTNNASDGDILIAYSLLLGALKWDEARYVQIAGPIIRDIGRRLVTHHNGHMIVRPAAYGFDGRGGRGQVVNLSYYIYGAFLMFAAVDDTVDWLGVWRSGIMLTEQATRRSGGHAPDWATLDPHRMMAPASGFDPRSSYDAVRIPLFKALHGRVPGEAFAAFDQTWNVRGRRVPVDYHMTQHRALMAMNEPGYKLIAAVAACAHRGVPIPGYLQRFRPTTYFASSLQLMALSAARINYPHCLQRTAPETLFAANNGQRHTRTAGVRQRTAQRW